MTNAFRVDPVRLEAAQEAAGHDASVMRDAMQEYNELGVYAIMHNSTCRNGEECGTMRNVRQSQSDCVAKIIPLMEELQRSLSDVATLLPPPTKQKEWKP